MISPKASIYGILLFHGVDRRIYDRVLAHGLAPEKARNVVALWMWLDLLGLHIIKHVGSCESEDKVSGLIVEAETILVFVRPGSVPPPPDLAIPLTASLTKEPLGLGFFFFNSEVAVRGLAHILDGVGRVMFDNGLKTMLDVYKATVRMSEEMEWTTGIHYEVPPLPVQLARGYDPEPVASPEDFRALFLTFSKGYPLKREEIEDYFVQKWGDCMEKVMIERPSNHSTPMYGRIIFRTESFIGLAMNGEQLVKFSIRGKQMWARQYHPRAGPMI